MTRQVLWLVPPPPAAETFDERRQAMLRAWQAALLYLDGAARASEIEGTAQAMRTLSDLHG